MRCLGSPRAQGERMDEGLLRPLGAPPKQGGAARKAAAKTNMTRTHERN